MGNFFEELAKGTQITKVEKTNEPVPHNTFDHLAADQQEDVLRSQRKEEIMSLRDIISTQLASQTKNMNLFGNDDPKVIEMIKGWIGDIIKGTGTTIPIFIQTELIEEMLLEITSLGKIHFLMQDLDVAEVMINSPTEVWIEKKGKLILTDVKFDNELQVLDLARRITGYIGRRVDNNNPIEDARLPDGSRVHIVIPPIAMKGTTITIRKFFQEKLVIQDLINFGTLSKQAAFFLESAVKARANIIISGGTGSGKTTTLNIVSNFVPNDERIITIEDSAELQLHNDHVVKLESRPANAEGKGQIDIRLLIKAALRMRPERIIVGEVRDGSAFDLMQACNTGHDGSMGTVHSNTPDACIVRLDNLVLQAGLDLPSRSIRQLIVDAVDLIVQIQRLKDGSRKITHISEVAEYIPESESVVTKNIFEWRMTGTKNGKLTGDFVYTGYVPTTELLDKFEKQNIDFEESIKGGAA